MKSWINDIIGLAGLALLGWGLWGVDPRLAQVVVGMVLMGVAYRGAAQ